MSTQPPISDATDSSLPPAFTAKSTTSANHEHEWDLAVQLAVIEGYGVRARHTGLLHLDRSYVYPGGEYDLARLFACVDVTDVVRARRGEVLRNRRLCRHRPRRAAGGTSVGA